jgi:hypothetical protein
MGRTSIRITKFRDRAAYQAVVDFLARLYPDRPVEDFEVGLARLSCLVSHDADDEAAAALEAALRERGADLRLDRHDGAAPGPRRPDVSSTVELSPEIDLSFLDESRRRDASRRKGQEAPARSEGRAPWEE